MKYLAVLLSLVCLSSVAEAGLIYRVHNPQAGGSPASPGNPFTIAAPGGSTNVDIYVEQDGLTNLLTNDGVFSAGFRVNYDPSIVSTNFATDVTTSASFAIDTSNSSSGSVAITLLTAGGTPVVGSNNSLYLATVKFTGVAPGVSTLLVNDLFESSDDWSFGDGSVVGPEPGASSGADDKITVGNFNAVPEPSALALVGLAIAGAVARRRMRAN